MHYKTMILELLQHQHPEIHNQLRSNRVLLPIVELYARELKTNHEAWKTCLSQVRPHSNPSQIASEALEIALKELEDSLLSALPSKGGEPLPAEAVMVFTRGRTPRA
jgi:hypothetical protein